MPWMGQTSSALYVREKTRDAGRGGGTLAARETRTTEVIRSFFMYPNFARRRIQDCAPRAPPVRGKAAGWLGRVKL